MNTDEGGSPAGRPHGIPEAGEHSVAHLLESVHDQLRRVEGLVTDPEAAREPVPPPGWRQTHEGEQRLPAFLAVAAAVALQLVLPAHLAIHPYWLLPALEGVPGIGLMLANPTRIDRASSILRLASIALIALISLANAWATVLLVRDLIDGRNSDNASLLLAHGANVYLTNILVFALWYWEWDRGGPAARALATKPYPDFLFPQMSDAHLAPPDWTPKFLDYLYVSFTNATAFSPTDTMPLSRWAKMLMLLQSAVALLTVALVVSRAINVLK